MTDYRFEIEREPLFRKDKEDSLYDALYRADNGEQLAVVSRDYQLISHSEAVDSYYKIFDSMGETVKEHRFETSNRGKKFRGEFQLIDHEFDFNGDHFFPTLILENSIDRTKSFQSRFGLYRLICSNGSIVSLEETQRVKIPHYMDYINLDEIGEGVRHGLDELVAKFQDQYNHRNEMLFGEKEINEFLQSNSFPLTFKIEVAQELTNMAIASFNYERTSNLLKPTEVTGMDAINGYIWWNVLTQVATHKIQSMTKRAKIDDLIERLY